MRSARRALQDGRPSWAALLAALVLALLAPAAAVAPAQAMPPRDDEDPPPTEPVDTAPPKITVTAPAGDHDGWYKDTVALSVSATDSGVAAPGEITQVAPPKVLGDAKVGETLLVTAGAYDVEPDEITYRWLRDGAPVDGATGPTYRLTDADAGRSVRVEVTASWAGYADRVWTSDPMAVPAPATTGGKGSSAGKVAPTVSVKTKAVGKRKVRLTIKVAAGGRKPAGTVTVLRGKKVLRSGVALKNGVAKVVVKKLPKGKKVRLTVKYSGAADVLAASARSAPVRVR